MKILCRASQIELHISRRFDEPLKSADVLLRQVTETSNDVVSARANFSNLSIVLDSKTHDCVPQAGAKRNEVPTQRSCLSTVSDKSRLKGKCMRKIAIAVAAVAALSTTVITVSTEAEARSRRGRNAAVGLGIAGAALGAAAIANGAGYYGPAYGYGYAPRRYYDANAYYYDGPRYRHRHHHHHYGW